MRSPDRPSQRREQKPALHDGGDLLPLLRSRVSPSRVVRTGMEDKDGELGSFLQIIQETLEV